MTPWRRQGDIGVAPLKIAPAGHLWFWQRLALDFGDYSQRVGVLGEQRIRDFSGISTSSKAHQGSLRTITLRGGYGRRQGS
jgi:hypothetical protein